MRKLFGVWLLVAAGCTMPAGPESIQTDPPRVWPGLEMPVPTPPVPLARIGVEFLPAADGAAELLDANSLGMSAQPEIGPGRALTPAWRDPLEGFLEPIEDVRVLSLLEDTAAEPERPYPMRLRMGRSESAPG